ncbi:hypothetical protein PHLGIDRAFT_107014 [Phlebiopsis gigantea 11061_1 CR5-6]|uniref:Uncharacterized protein n=1 Tax=Phlebiopsis gigantea (strain 11061_1 CR5-6) TaxID=745531 RepID=A0A0C3RX82_PHLG1|nr:hypothetical protein PHLGIDRAFT_107014 [Phlebiopsis gigantea 11061_1 CR5-6]
MYMGESDAKFPNQTGSGLPPSPTRENPGQVFPKSDPKAAPQESVPGTGGERGPASVMGNPYAFKDVLDKLDVALEEAIMAIRAKEDSVSSSTSENALIQKLQSWRDELMTLTAVQGKKGSVEQAVTTQEGPMFTD